MIDTAVSTLAKDTVESARDAVDTARELAQDRLHDVTHRGGRKQRSRKRRGLVILVALLAVVGVAFFVVKRQREQQVQLERDTAPDPFGAAVDAEHEANVFTRSN
jgi:hypothetical protein